MTVTRVTPSTSRSAARNFATDSCPDAHPWMSSDGPNTPSVGAVELELAEVDDESGDAVAVRFVNQTSPGITMASSRSTRSQSNRLVARLVTVSCRASCNAAKSA